MAAEIDRIAATRRPDTRLSGYQRWQQLGFFHWRVPAATLRPLVPQSLELDTFDGEAWVGVVPFRMLGVRPRWAPRALAFEFLETNVRTYVHVGGRDPGVYFFSLEAASRIAVQVARSGWSLPYYFADMHMERQGQVIEYRSRRQSRFPQAAPEPRDPRLRVRYQVGDLLGASRPGTLEFFLFERYLLHTEKAGVLLTGQVHHAPYPVKQARVLELEDQLLLAAGLPQGTHPPDLAHYSEGVEVEIFQLAPRT